MTLRVVRETHDHLRARSAKVRDRALLAWRAHAAAQVRAQLATQRVAERAAAEVRGLVAEGRIPASRARVEVERIMRRAEVEIRAQVLAALARSANTARGIAPVVPAGSSAESSPLGGAAMIGNLPRSSPMTREQRREFVRVRGQGEGTEVVAGRFDATTAAAMRNAERASLAYRASSRLRARTDETVARVARTIEDGLRTRDSAIGIVRKVASVDATRITLAGYVEDVVAAIQSGEIEDPRARARLLATVQNAASRLGSAYDGERTIRAAVDRLAGAIEREDVQATADAVEGYIARKYRYEVGRIVRTEGMRAFARASLDRMRSTPGVYAYEWRLSPSHPEPDICDVFARADLHGLGPGCYPVGQGPVAPAHPNCTCVMVPKISPESIRAARRGERMPRGKPADRSWSDWLRKRDRATQEAIVGIGAADLLAAGVDVVTSGGRVRPLWDLLGSGPPMRYAAGRPVDIERGEWSPVLDAPVAADEAPKPTGPEAYGEIGKRAGVRSMVEGAELVIPEYVADEAGIDAALSTIGPKWPSIEYVFDEMVPEGEPPPTVEVAFVDGVPRVVSARFPDGTRIESSMPRNMFRVNVSRISGEFEDYDEKVIVSELRSALWWKLADPDVLFRMLREKASGADPVNGIVMDGPSVPDLSPFTKRASFTAVTGVFDQSILSELVGMEVVGERGGDGGKRRDRTVQILDRDVEAAIVGASRRLVDAWSSVRDFNVEDTDDYDEQLHNVAILRSDPNILAIATKPLRGETMTPEEVATLDAIAPRWRSVIKGAARSIVGDYAVRDNVLDDAVIRIPEAQWKAAPDAGAGGSEIRVGPVIEGAYKRDPGFVNASIRAVRVGVLGAWITLPGFVQAASIANGTSLVEGPVVRSIVVRQAPIRRGPAVYSGETFPVGGMTHHGFAEQRGNAARLVERALARGAFEGAGSDAEDRFKLGFVPNGAIETDAASSALASLDTIVRALGVPKEERGRLALAVHSSIPAERVVDAEGTVAWLATKAQSILANRSDTFKTTFTREEKPNGEIRYTGWMHVQSLDVVARTGAYTAAVFPRRGLSANDASDRYPTGTWIEVEFGAGDMVDHWQYGGALVVRDVSTGSLAMRADTSGMRPRIVMESADPALPPSVAALNARLRDESIQALRPPAPRDATAIRAVAAARTEIARTTRLLSEKPTMPQAARVILERNVEKAAAKIASLADAVRGHEAEVEFEVERGTGYPSPMREGRLRTLPFESRIEVRRPSEVELSKLSRSIDLITRKVSPEGIRVVESIVRGSTYRPSAANAPFAAPLGHADSTQKIRTFRAFTADEMEAMPTVNGIQSGTTIALRPMVLQSFQSWAHKRSIAASLGEQRAALWDRELDPVEADEWRSARIAIHEFVHATSPQSGSPMTYASIGRAVEEVSTEVVARAIIRRLSGGPEDPSADPPEAFQGGRFEDTDAYETLLPADRIEAGVRSPGHKVDASYSQWINPLVEAVTVAIFPEGDGREAARRVERAAVEYRTLSGSDVSSTELIPPEALRMLQRITSRDATVASGDARVERRIHAGTWAFLRGLGLDDARTLRVLELWDERGGTG